MDGLTIVMREAFGPYPAGARVVFDADAVLVGQELVDRGIAELAPPIHPPEVERPRVVKVILCADKIFTSPALYPSDCFGCDPVAAAKYLKTGAAHLATEADLRAFYNPGRNLAPEPRR